ncbi:MAG: hypothetical protein ACTJG2_00885 [Candidatus Saccharimonadales bacterium]
MNERITPSSQNVIYLKDRLRGDTEDGRRRQVTIFLHEHEQTIDALPDYVRSGLLRETATYQSGEAGEDSTVLEDVLFELQGAVETHDTAMLEHLAEEYEKAKQEARQLGARAVQSTENIPRNTRPLLRIVQTDTPR